MLKLCFFFFTQKFRSGTTCCLVVIRDSKLCIAWCGDSQLLLVKDAKPFYMTEAHKPDNDKERKRIESLGGTVTYSSKDWRVNGVLSIARTFGDIDHQPFVTCDPEVIEIDLDGSEDYMILGCDGLWEHSDLNIHLNETCNFISDVIRDDNQSLNKISELLVRKAQDLGSGDNISSIFVLLNRKHLLISI